MKIFIEDKDLQELIFSGASKKYKKASRDSRLLDALVRVYRVLSASDSVGALPGFLHFEALKYSYSGKYSLRILNGRIERLIVSLSEEDGVTVISILELSTDHYGNG